MSGGLAKRKHVLYDALTLAISASRARPTHWPAQVIANEVESLVVDIVAWVDPLGTPLAYQMGLPLNARSPPTSW